MKLFDTIGEFLRTLFVPGEAPKKAPKPGAQTHGGFRDGFEKTAGQRVNLTGVAPAMIVVPEEKPDLTPQPDNDFVASLDDLPLDAAPIESAPDIAEFAGATSDVPMEKVALVETSLLSVVRDEALVTGSSSTEAATTEAVGTEVVPTAAEPAPSVESEPVPDASAPPSDPQLQEKLHS